MHALLSGNAAEAVIIAGDFNSLPGSAVRCTFTVTLAMLLTAQRFALHFMIPLSPLLFVYLSDAGA